MAGVSGLVELLCKSHFDSDPADSPSIALTQLGTDSIEASPCGFRAPLTRRTILSQTTVEDALNRLRHFSNTLLGADSRLSARFFHLLCKLYYDSTVSRIPLLKLCCDKLSPVLQLLPPAGNSGRTQDIPLPQRIEEMCTNGRLQQPFHHLVSTVTLILYPPAEVRSDGREEPRKSELSSLLNQLVELLISLEPEEFHLDKGAAFDASSEGKANALKRSLLLSLDLSVIYVRIAGIERIRQRPGSDPAVIVLMIGQITSMLQNLVVRSGKRWKRRNCIDWAGRNRRILT